MLIKILIVAIVVNCCRAQPPLSPAGQLGVTRGARYAGFVPGTALPYGQLGSYGTGLYGFGQADLAGLYGQTGLGGIYGGGLSGRNFGLGGIYGGGLSGRQLGLGGIYGGGLSGRQLGLGGIFGQTALGGTYGAGLLGRQVGLGGIYGQTALGGPYGAGLIGRQVGLGGLYGQAGLGGSLGYGTALVGGQGITLDDIYSVYGDRVGRVNAAVISTRDIQFVPVPSQYEPPIPVVVDIDPIEQPLVLNFGSRSSSLFAIQSHQGQEGSVQRTQSVDEPHHLIHEVIRPVIQEVREVIQPERRIIQQITPIVENVQTIVARGEGPRPVSPLAGAALGAVRSEYLQGFGGPIGRVGLLGGAGLLGAPGLIGGAYGYGYRASPGLVGYTGAGLGGGLGVGLGAGLGTGGLIGSPAPAVIGGGTLGLGVPGGLVGDTGIIGAGGLGTGGLTAFSGNGLVGGIGIGGTGFDESVGGLAAGELSGGGLAGGGGFGGGIGAGGIGRFGLRELPITQRRA